MEVPANKVYNQLGNAGTFNMTVGAGGAPVFLSSPRLIGVTDKSNFKVNVRVLTRLRVYASFCMHILAYSFLYVIV